MKRKLLKQQIKSIKKENQEGITLVVLVVTVILLFILAQIGIESFTSERGLLKQAQNSTVEHYLGADKESIQELALRCLNSRTGTVDFQKLNEELNKLNSYKIDGTPAQDARYVKIIKSGSPDLYVDENANVLEQPPN